MKITIRTLLLVSFVGLVFCIVMFSLRAHPVLKTFFELLWILAAVALLFMALPHRQRFQQGNKQVSFDEQKVPLEQLEEMSLRVQQIGVALTEEMELTRHAYVLMYGEVPFSAEYATLKVAFEDLIRVLNHFGFPFIDSLQLQQKDVAFIQEWVSDLEEHLQLLQGHTQG